MHRITLYIIVAVLLLVGSIAAAWCMSVGSAASVFDSLPGTTTPDVLTTDDTSTTEAASPTATTTPVSNAAASSTDTTASTSPVAVPALRPTSPRPPHIVSTNAATPHMRDFFTLVAGGVPVRIRFAPSASSKSVMTPHVVATSSLSASDEVTAAVAFGPAAEVALGGHARIEFMGAAASSSVATLAPDGSLVSITQECVAGAAAPRDLFLTYTGGDCWTTWGVNLIILTDHAGTFAIIQNDNETALDRSSYSVSN